MTQTAAARLTGSVQHMCFLRAGSELVVVAARNQGVELIDSDDGRTLRVIAAGRTATSLLPLPTGDPTRELLLVGGPDGTVRGYDPATGEQPLDRTLGAGSVKDLAVYGEPGAQTVVAVLDSGVHLWRLDSGTIERLPDPDDLDPSRLFKSCAYQSAGRQRVTCAYTDGYLATWDLELGGVVVQRAHDGPIWSLIVTDDGEDDSGVPVVVTGGSDRRMRAWRPRDGELAAREVFVADGTIRRLGHVTDQRTTMLITASASGAVSLWRLDGSPDRP
jgi:WD40 repeat protein